MPWLEALPEADLPLGASLAAGPVEDGVVSCHLHFWSFDLRTGACTQVPGLALRVFPVKSEKGMIHVEV